MLAMERKDAGGPQEAVFIDVPGIVVSLVDHTKTDPLGETVGLSSCMDELTPRVRSPLRPLSPSNSVLRNGPLFAILLSTL